MNRIDRVRSRLLAPLVLAVWALAACSDVDSGSNLAPIEPLRVIEGSFTSEMQGSYVMVPFDVPAGTTQIRV
ncbi:MAG: hypothetical protein ACKO2K_20830, partial [Alphaproteobacteria bacterium]